MIPLLAALPNISRIQPFDIQVNSNAIPSDQNNSIPISKEIFCNSKKCTVQQQFA